MRLILTVPVTSTVLTNIYLPSRMNALDFVIVSVYFPHNVGVTVIFVPGLSHVRNNVFYDNLFLILEGFMEYVLHDRVFKQGNLPWLFTEHFIKRQYFWVHRLDFYVMNFAIIVVNPRHLCCSKSTIECVSV